MYINAEWYTEPEAQAYVDKLEAQISERDKFISSVRSYYSENLSWDELFEEDYQRLATDSNVGGKKWRCGEMSKQIHVCVDIRGALRNPKMFRGNLLDDKGRPVYDVKEIKRLLQYELDLGHKFLPVCGCDNFDYTKGCLGHEIEDGGAEK